MLYTDFYGIFISDAQLISDSATQNCKCTSGSEGQCFWPRGVAHASLLMALWFLPGSPFCSPLAPSCSTAPCLVSETSLPPETTLLPTPHLPFCGSPLYLLQCLITSQPHLGNQEKTIKEGSYRKNKKFATFLYSNTRPVFSRKRGQDMQFISPDPDGTLDFCKYCVSSR